MYMFVSMAVANGPVGPAMAGPIIEPVILKKNCFLVFIFWLGLVGIINVRVPFFFRYSFWSGNDSRHKLICTLTIRFLCSFCPSHNMVRQAVVNMPGPQVHEEFVGIYSVHQTDAGTNTTVTTECVPPDEPTSEQVSQIVLNWSWQH